RPPSSAGSWSGPGVEGPPGAGRRTSAAGRRTTTRTGDALPRHGTDLEPVGCDRAAARLAHAVGAGGEPRLGGVELGEVRVRLADERADLGTLERDRRALGVVLV